MKGKILVMSAFVFAFILIIGIGGAFNSWSFPVPTKINLIPTPIFAFIDATYKLNATTYRYTSMDVTVQNIGLEIMNCTVEVSLLQSGNQIASGKNTAYNILPSANQTITIILSWSSGNLTVVTSGYILIY